MDYTQIKISEIPALFPTVDFTDRRYVQYRVNRDPELFKSKVYTDELFALSYESTVIHRKQLIQSRFYEQFELFIDIQENTNIDLVNIAKTVTIICTDATQINAAIIDIKYNKLADTYIYRAILSFYALQADSKSVNNYLTASYLLSKYTYTQLNRLVLSQTRNLDSDWDFLDQSLVFYTPLVAKKSRSDMAIKSDSSTGIAYLSSAIDFDTITLRFYLTTQEMQRMKKYLPRCFYHDSGGLPKGTRMYLTTDATVYQAIEFCQPKIKIIQELVELYECEVELKYSQIIS